MNPAELIAELQDLLTVDPEAVADKDLLQHAAKYEEVMAAVHAAAMPVQAAVVTRKPHRSIQCRSGSTGLAYLTRLSPRTCGAHLNQADMLVNLLPAVYRSFQMGLFTEDQIRLICSYARRSELREQAVRDQDAFINWASDPWPKFQNVMAAWAELADDTDPNDADEKAFLDRHFKWAQGVGRTVLIEWNLPNDLFEQVHSILQPLYDMMVVEEYRDVKKRIREQKEAAGETYVENEVEIAFTDLARSNGMRWNDAIVMAIRISGSVINKLIAKKKSAAGAKNQTDNRSTTGTAAGAAPTDTGSRSPEPTSTRSPCDADDIPTDATDNENEAEDTELPESDRFPAEPTLSLQDLEDQIRELSIGIDDLDPGTAPELIIFADQKTLEDEIARQNGEEVAARPASDAEIYRCETLSGLPISPTTAVRYLTVGSFRRMVMKPDDLDFAISRRARLFKGAKRLGLVARDRTCQGRGCDTPANRCEADHILEHTKGGLTLANNGEMDCPPCHGLKTELQAQGIWKPDR